MLITVDTLIVLGIQDLKQIAVLKPISIDIGTAEPFNNCIQKYPPKKFVYRFRLTSVTISTSMKNLNNTILITCVGLNETSNLSFIFLNKSIYYISKLNIYLKNGKNEDILFEEGEEKIPQFNFTIDALYG